MEVMVAPNPASFVGEGVVREIMFDLDSIAQGLDSRAPYRSHRPLVLPMYLHSLFT